MVWWRQGGGKKGGGREGELVPGDEPKFLHAAQNQCAKNTLEAIESQKLHIIQTSILEIESNR